LKYILLTLIILFSSCSSHTLKNYERRNTKEYYDGIGVVQYFLAELPSWANFSSAGGCHRSVPVRYLHLQNVRNSFSLSYEEAIQFQLMFNELSYELMNKAAATYIPFKDEEKIFYTVLDKIKAGIRNFVKPKYKVVNLLWLDSAIGNKKQLRKIRSLIASKRFSTGHPVFVSLCMSQKELKSFVIKSGLKLDGAKYLTYEMLNPYNSENDLESVPMLELNKIFNKKQRINFFLPREKPAEFKGKFNIRKF
jgi:hypothetical protein